ncbi:MAG: GNAT family N-acetyltransferase, partial [Erysipelotrichia bacterium]|nr:GNAT family N-acetyltransferase [Erysipelotrichia bacterium]
MELQKGTGNIEQIALQGMSERVTQENKDLFGDISASISEQREDEAYLDLIASSEKRRGYLYLWEGKYVGTYVIGTEENGTFIYGVGIRKEYQGKGISRYMMKQAVMCAFNETNRVFLEVDSHNPAALNLYRHCGFQTIFQVDYDRIEV